MMRSPLPVPPRPLIRRGFTFIEFLVAGLIIVVIGAGIGTILNAHWNAYRDTLYQNRANLEARRALDGICDLVRAAGADSDIIDRINLKSFLDGTSNGTYLGINRSFDGFPNQFYIQQIDGHPYLVMKDADNVVTKIAQYITEVHFEYEYRQYIQDNGWTFARTIAPTGDLFRRISTIYITVKAQIPASITGGPVYERTLTSAVHLRGTYNPIGT